MIDILISEISQCSNEEDSLAKALFGVILLLENRSNYKEDQKFHPISELNDFISYIALKNKISSKLIDDSKGFKLCESKEYGEILINKRISKDGLHYLSSSHELFPVFHDEPKERKSYDFEVALSFANEDRDIAEAIANKLSKDYHLSVFYDTYEKYKTWGKDLYTFLFQTYSERSYLCVILFSEQYQKKIWTKLELRAVQLRLLNEKLDYLLPLKLDTTDLPIELNTISYLQFSMKDLNDICQTISDRVWDDKLDYWYTEEDLARYLNMSQMVQIFLDEFYPEFEKEKNRKKLLVKLIITLAFLFEEYVTVEVKGFFEYLIFGFQPVSSKFKDDKFNMISPDCYLRRTLNGKSIFNIQDSYWRPIFNKYKQEADEND